MKQGFVTFIIALFFSIAAYGHGEHVAGPNGGNVKMPGAYHIEFVSLDNEVRLYVLDIQFKPVDLSKAKINLLVEKPTKKTIDCKRQQAYFSCTLTKEELKQYKEVRVLSSQRGEKFASSIYKLPLNF